VGALLIAQSDAPGLARAEEIERMRAVCEERGATECFVTDDPDEGEQFAAARRAFFPAMEHRGSLMLEDVGVPVPLLPTLLEGIAGIAAQREVEIPVVAHAGDGNTHPIIVHPPGDDAARTRAAMAFTEIMALAVRLGGTITGEHGVGRLKRDSLADQLGPEVMDLTRRIKHALDPQGILNPGAAF
ncbi:MAG: FAD-binding oxidoreductase, partial [Micrococcales bacterium]|nr:FAD-binding oxidoreductase [Micrococcales bacterium]